jgi:LEA14-like dessication related protein
MDRKTKMALALAGATVLGLGLFFGYRQYKKIMSYAIKLSGKKLQKIDQKEIVIDLWVDVTNFADIPIRIKSQLYDIFINGKFLSKVYSGNDIIINPKQTTKIPLRVVIKSKDFGRVVGSNWAVALLQPEKIVIRIDFELRLSLWGIGIPVKNTYSIPLKELTKPAAT